MAADLHCMMTLGAACALTTPGAFCCITCRHARRQFQTVSGESAQKMYKRQIMGG